MQLEAAGDTQGAKDAAAVHGDDKDKAPASEAPLCGFRVLLSTLAYGEDTGTQWYKLAEVSPLAVLAVPTQSARDLLVLRWIAACQCVCQPKDIVEAGAVVCGGGSDETSHGTVLVKTKQSWNKKSMRSRLFGVLNS